MDSRVSNLIINHNFSLKEVIKTMDKYPIGMIFLCNENNILKGILTDGDIRRLILRGTHLNITAKEVMNKKFTYVNTGCSRSEILRIFSDKIKFIPVLNKNMQIIDVLFYNEFAQKYYNNKTPSMVRAKAPLRVSFAGGGTDVNPFIVTEGGVVISTTINKYCFGSLEKRDDKKISIYSRDYNMNILIEGIDKIIYDNKLDLIKSVIKLMKPVYGFNLYLETNVPPGSGLGGSSTVASVVAGLINHLRINKLDDYELADIIYQAERIELGIKGGWQDQYAAVFGGFNYIEFRKDDIIVHPLRIKDSILNELEASLTLCYTGQTHDSGVIHKNQMESFVNKKKEVTDALIQTKHIATKMKNVLLKGDLYSFGEILHEAWLLKKRFDPRISNSKIDHLYTVGKEAGAIGGKILGAGGGGYLLFFSDPLEKYKIRDELVNNGGQIFDFSFDCQGLHTWTI